jgi:hypothetical protein
MAEKTCKTCLVSKSADEFYRQASKKDGLQNSCKQCNIDRRKARYLDNREATLAKNKLWRDANKGKTRAISRKETLNRYGLTTETYTALLIKQGGACATCEEFPDESSNLHVDHDHACCPGTKSCGSCIRGLLCMKCNTILGKAKDNPKLLRVLASYVEGGEF